jgi:hypothetical protein
MPCPLFWLEGGSGLAEEFIDEIGCRWMRSSWCRISAVSWSVVWGSVTGSGLGDFPAGIITE